MVKINFSIKILLSVALVLSCKPIPKDKSDTRSSTESIPTGNSSDVEASELEERKPIIEELETLNVDVTFFATVTEYQHLSFAVNQEYIEQTIVMDNEILPEEVKLNVKQVERTLVTKEFSNSDEVDDGDPNASTFQLDSDPDESTLKFSVDGIEVPQVSFNFNSGTKEITLDAFTIDVNQKLSISYRLNEFLPSTFLIRKTAVETSIKASVAGVSSEIMGFQQVTGELTLKEAPKDGSEILIEYTANEEGGPRLRYPLVIKEGSDESISIKESESGNPVEFTFSNGEMEIKEDAFQKSKSIVARFRPIDVIDNKYPLPKPSIDKKLSLKEETEGGETKDCDQSKLKISDDEVIADCHFNDNSTVLVDYKAENRRLQSFIVNQVFPDIKGIWKVYINDKETKEYKREGNTISLNEIPPLSAEVRVYVKVFLENK